MTALPGTIVRPCPICSRKAVIHGSAPIEAVCGSCFAVWMGSPEHTTMMEILSEGRTGRDIREHVTRGLQGLFILREGK